MRSFTVAFTVIAAVVAVSCDRVPLTSPTGSTIQLSASTNIVPVDGSAEITATVIESAGTAVQNGTTVIFRTDLGRMDPAESQTVNGRAVSRFFASGFSGVANINAYSGAAATGGSTPTNSSAPAPSKALTLLVGGAAASRISVRAEPPTIPQSGGTTQIFANVADANGAPVLGAPVTFSVSGGSGNTSPGILSSPSTQTNANGVAQTSLTTNQTTTVTATVATAATTTSVTANVIIAVLAAPTVTLTCTPPTTGFAAGLAVTCTLTPIPSGGVAILNVTVNWGDGSGEQPVGSVSGITTISHTYGSPGTYTVVASATDLNSQRGQASAAVVVNRLLPPISITGPTSGTGSVGVPVSFTVTPPPNPAVPIANITVDFGDGTSRSLGTPSSVQTISKTYTTEGNFTATATATDIAGTSGSSSTSILITRNSPSIAVSYTAPVRRDVPTKFDVTATAASGGPAVRSVEVRISDGTLVYSGTGTGSFSYTFPVVAMYTMTATVTDTSGGQSRQVQSIDVRP